MCSELCKSELADDIVDQLMQLWRAIGNARPSDMVSSSFSYSMNTLPLTFDAPPVNDHKLQNTGKLRRDSLVLSLPVRDISGLVVKWLFLWNSDSHASSTI